MSEKAFVVVVLLAFPKVFIIGAPESLEILFQSRFSFYNIFAF
jgi:hypothetical protein